jgi:hypothetical protein
MTTDLSSVIEHLIREVIAGRAPEPDWLRTLVEKSYVLPVYIGWDAFLGLRSDGSVVSVDTEQQPGEVKSINDQRERNFTYYLASKKYPGLTQLYPVRPANAKVCNHCGGIGSFDHLPGVKPGTIICFCGGLGWLPPDEPSLL